MSQRSQSGQSQKPRRERSPAPLRRQRGFALGEFLLLTAPLSILAMVIASKLTATSSARMKAQWKAELQAQIDAKAPCGIDPLLTAPALAAAAQSRPRKAAPVMIFGADLLFVNQKHDTVTERIPNYYFKTNADRQINDGLNSVTKKATFVCNEPMTDNNREIRKFGLIGLALFKARKMFGL